MKRFNLLTLSIFVMNFIVAVSFADNLSKYRQLDGQADFASSITNRTKTYRELLKPKADNAFPDLKLSDGAQDPLKYPAESIRPMRKFSSSYFRQALGGAAQVLKEQELHGKPRVFDPSKQLSELNEDKWNSRRQIFETEIINKKIGTTSVFDLILSQLIVDIYQPEPSGAADIGRTGYEQRLAVALRNWIKDYQPRPTAQSSDQSPKTIEEILGTLERVEVYDAYVTRLIFTKNDKSIRVSLPMLASVRSGEDEYFVMMLGFLDEKLEQLINDSYERDPKDGSFILKNNQRILKDAKEENQQRVRKWTDIEAYVSDLVTDATYANQTLLSLNLLQLNFLIDLMIQLRLQDIPADGELNSLKEKIASTATEQNSVDLVFYETLNRQLGKLQFQLEFEQGRAK